MPTYAKNSLMFLTIQAEIVGRAVPGYWSVDFCRHKNGAWYLTDMAEGDQSYHWATCPHASPEIARYGNPLIDGDVPSIDDLFS